MKFQKDLTIIIKSEICHQMINCVNKAEPNEACGLIFGIIQQIENPNLKGDYLYKYYTKYFTCIESDKKSTVAFLIENIETLHEILQKTIVAQKLEKNMRLISIFHSHPAGTSPSGIDLSHMKYLDEFSQLNNKYISRVFKNQIWTIMSATNYQINAYIYLENELRQINLEIEDPLKK